MRFATLIWLFVSALVAACVSVSFGSHETKRATGVNYSEPSSPFAREDRSDVDGAWKNSRNGNLISFITDCHDESDPPLETIVSGAMNGLSDLKYEKREAPMIQGREGRRVLASGKVDGVPSQIDLVAFKRDNCIYILSYVGVQSAFAADHAQFDHFLERFHAP